MFVTQRKPFVTFLIVILVIACLIWGAYSLFTPSEAEGTEPVVADGLRYTAYQEGWSVSMAEDYSGEALTIPSSYDGKPVLKIEGLYSTPTLRKLTIHLGEATRNLQKGMFGDIGGIVDLHLVVEEGCSLTVKANAFDDCAALTDLTVSGGKVTFEANSFPDTPNFQSMTLSGGSFELLARCLEKNRDVDRMVFDTATLSIDAASGFYHAHVQNMTVRNTTLELSQYRLTEVYPTVSVGTLYLGAGARVSATTEVSYPADKLVLEEDFSFENGSVAITLQYGFLGVQTRWAPIASEIHIPVGITSIPANFFGNEDACAVYYDGLASDFNSITVDREGNQALFDGLVQIYGLEQSTQDVVFHARGGTETETTKVTYGQRIYPPSDPVRDGYAFLGWFTEAEGGRAWNFETDLVTSEVHLYAHWLNLASCGDCEITANHGFTQTQEDGQTVYRQTVEKGLPSLDISGAFSFSAYATVTVRAKGGQADLPQTALPLSDGENRFVLTVTSGNGRNQSTYELVVTRPYTCVVWFDDGANAVSVEVDAGSLLDPLPVIREGYVSEGWFLRDTRWDFASMKVTEDMTLNAKWTAKTYTVTLRDGGEVTVTYGSDYSLTVPAQPGCVFNGWKTEDGVFLTDQNGNSLTPWRMDGNVTLEPDFSARAYRVVYENLMGGDNPNPLSHGADRALNLQAPSAVGYEFTGWVWNGETVTQIPVGQTEDVTLTASWTPVPYRITYENTKGQAVTSATSYTVEDSVALPALEMEGYVFLGWYLNGEAISEIAEGTTGDMTLRAEWQGEIYEITFEGVEEATHNNPLSYEFGVGVLLEDASRDGYTFLGWYCEGEAITELSDDFAGDVTLTARWEIHSYTVTFTDAGGSVLHTEVVTHGSGVVAPPSPPVLYRKIFVGWSADINRITGDVTVAPIYKEHTYTVTFDTDGGTDVPSLEVYYGEIPAKPQPPVKDGIAFENWYLSDGTVYDFSYALDADTVITAGWMDYIPIRVPEDFAAMEGSDGKFRLMNDINFYNEVFTAIESFSGSFDGGGHTLSAFSLNGSGNLAMFLTNKGTIKNLTVRNASVQMTMSYNDIRLALFVGKNEGTVENCHLENCFFGMVKTKAVKCDPAGLLCAYNAGVIKGCTVQASEAELSWTYNTYGTNYCEGSESHFGGIAGYSTGTIENCAAEVSVRFTAPYQDNDRNWYDDDVSYMMIGAVGGEMSGGTASNCIGKLTLNGSALGGRGAIDVRIGGLFGYAEAGVMENSIADIDLTMEHSSGDAALYLGGAIGMVNTGFEVKNCVSYGVMRRNDTAHKNLMGGFVARNAGNIRNSYALVALDVKRDTRAAGFCAENTSSATIRSCFAAGYLYAESGYAPDAFVDANSGSILSCYYDAAMSVVDRNEQVLSASDPVATSVGFSELTSPDFMAGTLSWNLGIWNCRSAYWPSLFRIGAPAMIAASCNRYEYGSISVSDSRPDEGDLVTLTATPFDTFCFVGWYRKGQEDGEALSTDAVFTFTAEEGLTLVEARFRQQDLHVDSYEDLVMIGQYNLAGTTVYIDGDINCMGAPLPMVENFYATLDASNRETADEKDGYCIYNFANTRSEAGDSALIRNNYGVIRNLTLFGSAVASTASGETRLSFFTACNHEGGLLENCHAVGSLRITGEQKAKNAGGAISFSVGAFAAENAGTIQGCSLTPYATGLDLPSTMTFDARILSRLVISDGGNLNVNATLRGGFIAGRNTGRILDCDTFGASFGSPEASAQFENNVVIYRTGLLASSATGRGYMNVFVGGIAGTNDEGGVISACVDSSTMYVNDLAGTDLNNESGGLRFEGVHNAYFHSDVNLGGIVGQNAGSVDHSLSDGMITYNSDNINRMGASTAGLMDQLRSAIGGISGKNTGTVENTSHRGILIATSAQTTYVGAVSGDNRGTVSNCYGGGMILAEGISDSKPVYLNLKFWTGFGGSRYRHGSVSVGGLVGCNATAATVTNSLSNYRFDKMNNVDDMTDYESFINHTLLLPLHIRDAFLALFDTPPAYANVLQIGTIVGNGQNLGNIQNCYYVKNGEYTYADGEQLTDDLSAVTGLLIHQKLNWSIETEENREGPFDWIVVKDYYVDPDHAGGGTSLPLLPTISLIPVGTETKIVSPS